MVNYKISVVTVTYGKRWHFLSQTLSSIKDNPLVVDIIVVDNGSKEDIESLCKDLNSSKIFVVKTGENLGSAGGFAKGIKVAFEQGKGDFIFLLDDDNVVEENCLETLLDLYHKFGDDVNVCLKAFKYNNKSDILLSLNGWKYFDFPNSFFNFHILNRIKQYFCEKKLLYENEFLSVRGVAYSGFVFHKSLVNKVGLPKEDLVLYGDDTEYSLRFLRNGCKIYLSLKARLKDIDISWHHKEFNINPFLSPVSDMIKSYYGARNRVYVEKIYLVKNIFVYFINAIIFLTYIFIKALLLEKNKKEVIKRFRLFIRACKEGWNGHLGKKFDLSNI